MTTVLSKKGQIVIPGPIRERLSLEAGDDFEIMTDGDESIILRKISRRPNQGLIEHLLACPFPLEMPERSEELPREVRIGD